MNKAVPATPFEEAKILNSELSITDPIIHRVIFNDAEFIGHNGRDSVTIDFYLQPPPIEVMDALDSFTKETEHLAGFTPFETSYLHNSILKALEEVSIQQYIRRSIEAGKRLTKE